MGLLVSNLQTTQTTQTLQAKQSGKTFSTKTTDEIREELRIKSEKAKAERLKNVPKEVVEEFEECKDVYNSIRNQYITDIDCQEAKGYDTWGYPKLNFSQEKMMQKMSSFEKKYYNDCINKIQELLQKYPELLPCMTKFDPEKGFYWDIKNNDTENDKTSTNEVNDDNTPQQVQQPQQEEQQESKNKKGLNKLDKALLGVFGGVAGSAIAATTPTNDDGGSKVGKSIVKGALGIFGWLI